MKKTIYIISALLILCASNCRKNSDDSKQNQPKEVWKYIFKDGNDYFSIAPIIYKNIVITALEDFKNPINTVKIVALNRENGQKVWETDMLNFVGENLGSVNKAYQYDNMLVVSGGRSIYGINMDNGSIFWHHGSLRYVAGFVGGAGKYAACRVSRPDGLLTVESIDVYTGQRHLIYTSSSENEFIENNLQGDNIENNVPMVTFLVNKVDSARNFTHRLIRYDLENKRFIYQKELPASFEILSDLEENIGYIAGKGEVGAFNITNGELIKKINVEAGSGAGSDATNDKLIVGNSSGLYCYSISQNKKLWLYNTVTSGSARRFFIINGVVYYASYSTGRLVALEESNGNQIWSHGSSYMTFTSEMSIDNNRIYAATYKGLYCYEAAR